MYSNSQTAYTPTLNYSSPFAPIPPHPGLGRPTYGSSDDVAGRARAGSASSSISGDGWVVEESPGRTSRNLFKQGKQILKSAAVARDWPVLPPNKPPSFVAPPEKHSQAPLRPPPIPTKDRTVSEEELQEALRISEAELAEQEQREVSHVRLGNAVDKGQAAEFQKALDASKIDKGKERELERQPSTDPEELQRALSLSLHENTSGDSLDEDTSTSDFPRQQSHDIDAWEQSHRRSMFDTADTSSLSIISERTELPLRSDASSMRTDASDTASQLVTTPKAIQYEEETPSYFGLWLSSDAKGVLDQSDHMAILPPLSEMMAAARQPATPRLPQRPLPPVPSRPAPSRTDSELTNDIGDSSDGSGSSDTIPRTNTTAYHTASEPSSGPSSHANSSSSHATVTPGLENDEVTWPKHQAIKSLPPGARYAVMKRQADLSTKQASAPSVPPRTVESPALIAEPSNVPAVVSADEQEEDLVEAPEAVRYGYISSIQPELPPAEHFTPFPDVIQLSNMPEQASNVPEFSTFACEASTWSHLIKFLNWHSDTRIEAHPRDIQNEKVGCGETELAANFLRNDKGHDCVRVTVRLLPPNPHKRRRETLEPVPKATRVRRRNKSGVSSSEVNLPDHLVLPVNFSDVAALLSTLRHLAFIAAATQESKKGMLAGTSYHGLRQLGLRIAQLSEAHHRRQLGEEEKVGLRDRLRNKLGLV